MDVVYRETRCCEPFALKRVKLHTSLKSKIKFIADPSIELIGFNKLAPRMSAYGQVAHDVFGTDNRNDKTLNSAI